MGTTLVIFVKLSVNWYNIPFPIFFFGLVLVFLFKGFGSMRDENRGPTSGIPNFLLENGKITKMELSDLLVNFGMVMSFKEPQRPKC